MVIHTKTIRIDADTDRLIEELAVELLKTKKEILKNAVKAYKKEILFENANRAYEALMQDEEGWNQEIEERSIWDNTLQDGLEND